MKRIYFVRHGQSEWNVADKVCGATDIPLTEEGHRQAEETGRNILAQGIRADRILYSPLCRAADTALHISAMTGIPAFPEPRLTEQRLGCWEGSSPRRSPVFAQAKQQFINSFDGGESMLRLAQRVYNLLDDLRADDTAEAVILVSHNGIARVVESYFRDMTNEEYALFGVGNCEVRSYTFSVEGSAAAEKNAPAD